MMLIIAKRCARSARSFSIQFRAEISVMYLKIKVSGLQKETLFSRGQLLRGPFGGRKKRPEAAAGHNNLVLKRKTLFASMAYEGTDRTGRRVEIPPPERLHFAPLHKGGRPPKAAAPICGLLW